MAFWASSEVKVSIPCDISPSRAAPTLADSIQQSSLGAAEWQALLPHNLLQVVVYEAFGASVYVGDDWSVGSRHGCWLAVGAAEARDSLSELMGGTWEATGEQIEETLAEMSGRVEEQGRE
jgi:hypothetical protein